MSGFYLNRHCLAITHVWAFTQSLPAGGRIIARSRTDKIVALRLDRGELDMIASSSHGPLSFELAPPFAALIQFPDVDSAVLRAEGEWEPAAATPRARLDAAWPDFLKQVLPR